MRCPSCQTHNPPGRLACSRCTRRLFAWLGDPFGNLELPGSQPVAVATGSASVPAGAVCRAEFPVAKVIFAALMVWLVNQLSAPAALGLGLVAAALLWRYPTVKWSVLLIVVASTALLGTCIVAPMVSPRRAGQPAVGRPSALVIPTTTASARATAATQAVSTISAGPAALASQHVDLPVEKAP